MSLRPIFEIIINTHSYQRPVRYRMYVEQIANVDGKERYIVHGGGKSFTVERKMISEAVAWRVIGDFPPPTSKSAEMMKDLYLKMIYEEIDRHLGAAS